MLPSDPYRVLGVDRQAGDAELRAAYRRAVQREHPDHNGGSAEAARRFEAVQEAYALIRVQRTRAATGPARAAAADRPGGAGGPAPDPGRTPDPGVEARLAELERQLAEARAVREEARRVAREAEAQAPGRPGRASDEELGYFRTEDSFGQIVSDAAAELFADVRGRDVPGRVADLIDELGAKLTGEPPER